MAYDTFITYETMYDDIMHDLIPKLPRDIVAVIGIPRSGLIAATIISTEFHVPMGVLGCDGFFGGNRVKNISAAVGNKVVVIDDSVNSGKTFRQYEKEIVELSKTFEVIKASVYMKQGAEKTTSVFAKYLKVPRIFEWNLFNSFKIGEMIFDLDGVFCHDPEVFDDDGIKYQNNIANAIPLHIPTYPIKAICTNRIERWRGITEEWLKRYDIKYGKLVMCPYATAEERRKRGDKAKYKAKNYVTLNGSLFIESSMNQAKHIAEISKRNVLSLEDKRIYTP